MRSEDEAAIVSCIPSLRRYARGLVHDRDLADDLVQDTLERAWSRLSFWQKRGELRAWMFGIMHNHFVDRLRSSRTRPESTTGDDAPEQPQRARQADALEVRDLESALQRIPADQREVLLLVGVEDMTYQAVAALLDVPIGTVMSRLSRARVRLRAELQGESQVPATAPRIQRVK